jgi:hypothetical protein
MSRAMAFPGVLETQKTTSLAATLRVKADDALFSPAAKMAVSATRRSDS